jgi:hypothetical protein
MKNSFRKLLIFLNNIFSNFEGRIDALPSKFDRI